MEVRITVIKKVFTDVIFLFFTGAVIGWLYEVLLHVVRSGVIVNRGILHGPWLPIYGTGCLLIVGLKKLIGNKWQVHFMVSIAVCGMIEYVTSWALEEIYHTRWWDYSNYLWNLHGRIFVGGLLGFGVAGCLFSYGLLPLLKKRYINISANTKFWIAAVFSAVFLIDVVLSVFFPNMGTGITNAIT